MQRNAKLIQYTHLTCNLCKRNINPDYLNTHFCNGDEEHQTAYLKTYPTRIIRRNQYAKRE